MEVEVTVILDLPEMQRDLLPELPSPVRLKRDSSIIAFALFPEQHKKKPRRAMKKPGGGKENPNNGDRSD